MPCRNTIDPSLATQAKPKKRSKKALREANAVTVPAAAAKKAPAPPPPPSESEQSSEEEEEEAPTGPRIRGYAGGAFEALPAGDAAGWESVNVGKKKATGVRLSGSGTFSSAASRAGGSRAGQAAAQGKKRAEHACERPGCGAVGSRGFKKCGRWVLNCRSRQGGQRKAPGCWRE